MARDVNSDLTNLIDLLDDHDDLIFYKVSENIQSYGQAAIPFLEVASENAMDDLVFSRIKKIIHSIRLQNIYCELLNWGTLESDDLLKGYFIVSKYQFPELDEEYVMTKVEALRKDVWLELKKNMTPFEEAKVLSKVFFEVKKFKVNENSPTIKDGVCLNGLLNSGKGHEVAFTVLYAGIAQRLGIPVYGALMPEEVYLTYVYPKNPDHSDLKNDVIFYLNPFEVGTYFSNEQMKELQESLHPDDFEEYIGACTNTDFIMRLLDTFKHTYIRTHHPDKADDMDLLMKALEVE
jgi:regulator of sirC expression with transglutaminase-like and TPR domain